MELDTAKIKIIFEYEFWRGTNAVETARNVNVVFGKDTTYERTFFYLAPFFVETPPWGMNDEEDQSLK